MKAHAKRAKVKDIKGEIMNIIKLELFGKIASFNNNFKASANGCKTPSGPTSFGPFLFWVDAITFLSTKVKKATLINTPTIIIILKLRENKNILTF